MSALGRPEKLQRVIEMMSREYVHNDLVIHHTNSPRLLPTFIDELSNHYGLHIVREFRYFYNEATRAGKWNKVYHLPVQPESGAFAHAASLMADFYGPAAGALRELERSHPRADRSLPVLPGLAKDLLPREEVEERDVRAEALQMMSEPGQWLTVSAFHEMTGSTRLSEYVGRLIRMGINVITEMRPNPSGGRPFAAYHVFTDKSEEAEYLAETAEKARIQERHEVEAKEAAAFKKQQAQDAKVAKEAARIAKQAAKEASRHHSVDVAPVAPGGSRYGVWKGVAAVPTANAGGEPRRLFQAPATKPAPTPPSSAVRDRLLQMQSGVGMPEPIPRGSAPGVPAAELDKLHPRADKTTVVEFRGATYRKGFRPLVKSPDGTRVLKWDPYWFVVTGEQCVAPARQA